MTLVTRFLAARRDKLLMKAGCWLVCFSLVLGLMLPQQRAEALVAELTMASVAGAAAAYLCACGMPFVTQGMDKDALVSSVQRLIQEFLDAELAGITIQDWLGNVWDLAVLAGKLIMGRPLTDKMMVFAQWVAQKYGAQVGENLVSSSSTVTLVVNGITQSFSLTTYRKGSNGYEILSLGTVIPIGSTESSAVRLDVPSIGTYFYSFYCDTPGSWSFPFYNANGKRLSNMMFADEYNPDTFSFVLTPSGALAVGAFNTRGEFYFFNERTTYDLSLNVQTLGIDRAPSMSYIPDGLSAEQGVALDVGAAETMDLDLVLQGVLDDVIAGDLTSTMTAAGEEVVDPPAEEIPDVDNLGLPALGQALTSRFPFSIPWDFFRAVSLLAAPAKAPYFEVDFMEPLADDVGGWQGDTTVILDFSEYAIIGQISRWTSTIGFCLMLAGATKRLIWTA